jgi:putative methionine-R-sulfoxide reductase with GAF domain
VLGNKVISTGFGRRSPLQSLAVAAILIAVVTSIKVYGEPVIGRTRFLLYTTAVLLAAWNGGRNGGFAATFLGAFAVAYFFTPPYNSPLVENFSHVLQISLFVIEGILVSLIVASLENSRFWLTETAVKSSALRRIAQNMGDRARVRGQRIQAVLDLYRLALSSRPHGSILDSALEQITELLKADAAGIFELDGNGATVVLRAGVGWRDGAIGKARISRGLESLAGIALADGTPIAVEDLEADRRVRSEPLFRDHELTSAVAVPVSWSGRTLGVIEVFSCRRRRFGREEVQLLQKVVDVLGHEMSKPSPVGEAR